MSMRRKIGITLSMLLGLSLLCGCGNKLDVEESTVYVQKNGSVISTDIEDFSADYYDEDELKDYIGDEISSYTSENGKKSVSLESVSVKDSVAKLTMKYKTAEDYTNFNGVELYTGTIVKAMAAGYDFGVDFVSVKDGAVTGTATKDEIVDHDDYKVAVIKANTDVKVDGTIVYVSSQNVKVTGKNTVSIREGYLAADTTNVVGSTETVAETEAEEANQTEAVLEDEFASESDVYTYVIFK
ncbi:MAG: hypothetical protein MRZ75_00290 [Roseburia sp.]|uniref:hypothetical protein n=1 Tax=Roseburia sp. 831b TaxID=1261635 RepID=UPI001FA8970C|nr:hypothetical protein [Roseburia sp. 831b]MCI5917758.1 hypothetical protein [Roseburia sp.]WVK73687.1 hypothetical protein BIV16_04025 [Roseburia sp. 831b]